MKNYLYSLLVFCFTFLVHCETINAQTSTDTPEDFNKLSELFLQKIIDKENTQELQDIFANTTIATLDEALDSNAKRLAFWINIYNAYIQVILQKNPELYDDRGSFFKKEQIKIAGETISFAKIEHGLIRKSQFEYGLGYIRKWFPNKFERKLRVNDPVYHIHFALNCGAKDCPPVAIYEWQRLDEQFNKGTQQYLERTTDYDPSTKVATISSLFNWFRGDFGGKGGIKKILKNKGFIPTTKGIDLEYQNYDWTLDLNNFIEL
ncbi:DUF547 domain-containing protein [Maribacter confluentis]|uniref:DUF547 domain-containing protein n=1 Tax=Maribacter confluentis TaxID=1656093 RepID=A0ABT8RKD3_9FLAO|nr:DUF547 domain-containing protein [Maribacter confluentis]MDO1511418.1 DUF547 domain-containing protein [Maribacter confluentis]